MHRVMCMDKRSIGFGITLLLMFLIYLILIPLLCVCMAACK